MGNIDKKKAIKDIKAVKEILTETKDKNKQVLSKNDFRVFTFTFFKYHLAIYLLITTIMIVLNLMNGGYFWAIWPTLGWGLGVVVHFIAYLDLNKK